MNTHVITMSVRYVMTEMEGTAEASAEIALGLVEETLSRELAGDVTVEVTGYHDQDDLTCRCGNRPYLDGFYPCLDDGTEVEPDADGPWDGASYRCARCGQVHSLGVTA